MKRLLVVALFLPSLLLAQREPGERGERRRNLFEDSAGPPPKRAYAVGLVGYTGGLWQPSGIEFALLWRLGQNVTTAVGPWVAVGSFTTANAVVLGATKGFFAAVGVTARQPLLTIAEVGSERNPAYIKIEVAGDLGWSADFNSPLPQGRSDGRAALLAGISFGSAHPLGQSLSIMFGPAALIGRTTTTHGQFAMRFRIPLERRQPS